MDLPRLALPSALALPFALALVFIPSAQVALAQVPTRIQISEPHATAYESNSRMPSARFDNGDLLIAERLRQYHGYSPTSLVRLAPDGREIWRITGAAGPEFQPSEPAVFPRVAGPLSLRANDKIWSLRALEDGSALVTGAQKISQTSFVPFVLRIDAQGREVWHLRGQTASPVADNFFAELRVNQNEAGALFLTGMFLHGSFQLPGHPRWRPRHSANPFFARIDPQTGRVLWARRAPTFATTVITDTEILMVMADVRNHRRGDQPRFSTLIIRRFDLMGRRLSESRDQIEGASGLDGLVSLPGGSFAFVTETCRRQDAYQRCIREGHLYVYDGRDRRQLMRQVPAWSVLAQATPGAPLRVLAPSAIVHRRDGQSFRNVSDSMDLLTFRDPLGEPMLSRMRMPDTRFTGFSSECGGVSLSDGLYFHCPSVLLASASAGRNRDMAGQTFLFLRDDQTQPVVEIPRLTQEPLPPPASPAPSGLAF